MTVYDMYQQLWRLPTKALIILMLLKDYYQTDALLDLIDDLLGELEPE